MFLRAHAGKEMGKVVMPTPKSHNAVGPQVADFVGAVSAPKATMLRVPGGNDIDVRILNSRKLLIR